MKEAITFPELCASTDARPAACPRCRRAGLGRHQKLTRPVVDLKLSQVEVVQYQCEGCGASVTVTPPGRPPGGRHSERTKVLWVVLWGLGLSYRDAAVVMKGLGVPISHVEIIYNVREMGPAARVRSWAAGFWRRRSTLAPRRWCQTSWNPTNPQRRTPGWSISFVWRTGAKRWRVGSRRSPAMPRRRS